MLLRINNLDVENEPDSGPFLRKSSIRESHQEPKFSILYTGFSDLSETSGTFRHR